MLTRTPTPAIGIAARADLTATRTLDARRMPQLPPNDGDLRLLRQKLSYLTNRGFWPDIDQLAREHGWDSPELHKFIDKRIPTSRCPSCGQDVVQFRSYTRFCSDSCRRSYRKQGHEHESLSPASSRGMRTVA